MMGYGYGYWAMIIGTVITLVLLGGLIWLVVWAVRRSSSGVNSTYHAGGASSSQTAREVLDQRYARGEITRDQYQQMKQDLEG